MKRKFTRGGAANFSLHTTPPTDDFLAVRPSVGSIPILRQGTFDVDDFVRVTIEDDLTGLDNLELEVSGFRKEV